MICELCNSKVFLCKKWLSDLPFRSKKDFRIVHFIRFFSWKKLFLYYTIRLFENMAINHLSCYIKSFLVLQLLGFERLVYYTAIRSTIVQVDKLSTHPQVVYYIKHTRRQVSNHIQGTSLFIFLTLEQAPDLWHRRKFQWIERLNDVEEDSQCWEA